MTILIHRSLLFLSNCVSNGKNFTDSGEISETVFGQLDQPNKSLCIVAKYSTDGLYRYRRWIVSLYRRLVANKTPVLLRLPRKRAEQRLDTRATIAIISSPGREKKGGKTRKFGVFRRKLRKQRFLPSFERTFICGEWGRGLERIRRVEVAVDAGVQRKLRSLLPFCYYSPNDKVNTGREESIFTFKDN